MRLRFWLKNAAISACIGPVATLLYTGLMLLQGTGMTWEDICMLAMVYLWSFGALIAMILVMNLYKFYVPVAVSFGSTRKECMVGIACYRLIPLAVNIVCSLLLAALAEPVIPLGVLLPVSTGLYLLVGALGSAAGMAYEKYGKKAVFLVMLTGAAAAVIVAFGIVASDAQWYWINNALESGIVQWLVLAVGILAHVLSLIPEKKTVYRCTVKL